jgi:nitrate reductase gamma subunit
MLDALIDLAAGPLLRLSLLIMALGLARLLLLQIVELALAWRRAGDQVVRWGLVLRRNLAWTLPTQILRQRHRVLYNLASVVFHAGVIIVPVFFWGHVALWERGLGVSWPVLTPWIADALSLATVAALVWLLAARVATDASRGLSRTQDWVLPILCLLVFLTGLSAAHPAWSPIGARTAYLLHLLSGEALLVLVPFSKLQHMVLFWTSHTSTELGWRFPPGAGERVRLTLGTDRRGV